MLSIAAMFAATSLSLISCAPHSPHDPTPPSNDGSAIEPPPDTEQPEKPSWSSNFALPDADAAMAKLVEIYGSSDKIFLLRDERIARMPCPQGERISVNVTYEMNDRAKLVLDDCIAEFNEIFDVINPNYEFIVNYAPTDDEIEAEYSIKMTHAPTLSVTETSFALGMAHVSYYADFTELGDFGIILKDEVLTNGSYLMTTFKHELMHLLGAGDAYKNPAATKATVMQSYTVNGYHHLSKTDVAFIDALYRNPDSPCSAAQIEKYINDYEINNAHTKQNLTAAVYSALIAGADPADITAQIDAIGYADASGIAADIRNGLRPDRTFGTANVAFTELDYAEQRPETYFGRFDVDGGKYWHGTQKNTMGTSMGIGYTDHGGGILFAMPNGTANSTLFIRIADHVLLLRLGGGFTSLDALSLSVWHACSVDQ